MSRRTNAAARIQPLPVAARPGRRIRTTLGELIAAAYDAAGPNASAEDIARLLRQRDLAGGAQPARAID
jgi:hypothetical protein